MGWTSISHTEFIRWNVNISGWFCLYFYTSTGWPYKHSWHAEIFKYRRSTSAWWIQASQKMFSTLSEGGERQCPPFNLDSFPKASMKMIKSPIPFYFLTQSKATCLKLRKSWHSHWRRFQLEQGIPRLCLLSQLPSASSKVKCKDSWR